MNYYGLFNRNYFINDVISHDSLTDYELYHHGIKGQKWGVRRYQSYGTIPRKSGKGGKEIGKARTTKNVKLGMARYDMTGKYKGDTNDFDKYRQIRDYDREASLKSIDSFQGETNSDRELAYLNATYPSPALKIKESIENGTDNPYPRKVGYDGLLDIINPNYGDPGTTNNCAYAAATMEIAAKGYDVSARRSSGGCGTGIFERWFNGAKTVDYRAPFKDSSDNAAFIEAKQDMLKAGNGASGALITYYGESDKPLDDAGNQTLGGHALHWRNNNGNIVVEDAQAHRSCSIDDVTKEYGSNGEYCTTIRLDNCKPNWDNMAEDGVFGSRDPDHRKYSDGLSRRSFTDEKYAY